MQISQKFNFRKTKNKNEKIMTVVPRGHHSCCQLGHSRKGEIAVGRSNIACRAAYKYAALQVMVRSSSPEQRDPPCGEGWTITSLPQFYLFEHLESYHFFFEKQGVHNSGIFYFSRMIEQWITITPLHPIHWSGFSVALKVPRLTEMPS